MSSLAFAHSLCVGRSTLRGSFKPYSTTTSGNGITSVCKRYSVSMASSTTPSVPVDGTTLFIKAGPDTTSIGDCPFSQKANLALRFKKVDFGVHVVNLAEKPQWFLDLTEQGSVPVFLEGAHAIGDSDEIVDHADKAGSVPDLVLNREDDPNWDAAFDAVSPIFGSMVRFLKNKDDAEDGKLRSALADALVGLNTYLKSVNGPFILGDKVSALDCNLAPKLKHASVAPKHYKNFEFPSECTDVTDYLARFEQLDEWKATSCPDETIIWGWSKFFT